MRNDAPVTDQEMNAERGGGLSPGKQAVADQPALVWFSNAFFAALVWAQKAPPLFSCAWC